MLFLYMFPAIIMIYFGVDYYRNFIVAWHEQNTAFLLLSFLGLISIVVWGFFSFIEVCKWV